MLKKPYPLVYIRFLDHAQHSADLIRPIVCEVFGILKFHDKTAYVVCPWVCDYNLSDSNTDAYCILRSTVVEFKYIVGGRNRGKKHHPGNDGRIVGRLSKSTARRVEEQSQVGGNSGVGI